jgi:hypothetical protein
MMEHSVFTRVAMPDDVRAMLVCDAYAQSNTSRAEFVSEAVEKSQGRLSAQRRYRESR